jgi:hypothetical protein
MVAVQTQTTILREAPSKPLPAGPLALVTVALTAASRQPASGGLVYRLELKNDGESPVVVHNPLDALGIVLLDGKGWPVKLPPRSPPRIAVNTRGPMQRVFPFAVRAVENARGDKELARTAGEDTLTLAPKSVHRITMAIERVIASGREQPISPGRYDLHVVLALTSPGQSGRALVSNSLFIDLE